MSNPYIKDILDELDDIQSHKVKHLLKLIAETLPAENIGFESSKSNSKRISSPFEDAPKERDEVKKEMVESYIKQGMTKEEAEEQAEYVLNL